MTGVQTCALPICFPVTIGPVSEREINRNNAVAKLQNCRNPFIDYPDLANYIWGDKQDVAFYTESEITDPIIFSPWASDTVFLIMFLKVILAHKRFTFGVEI